VARGIALSEYRYLAAETPSLALHPYIHSQRLSNKGIFGMLYGISPK
jgi:hypothetical protein